MYLVFDTFQEGDFFVFGMLNAKNLAFSSLMLTTSKVKGEWDFMGMFVVVDEVGVVW